MTANPHKYPMLLILFLSAIISYAQNSPGTGVDPDTAVTSVAAVSSPGIIEEYEKALLINEQLSERKKALDDSVKTLKKQLNKLKDTQTSIEKSNRSLESRIERQRSNKHMAEYVALQQTKDSLLREISIQEQSATRLTGQLADANDRLKASSRRRDDLVKVKDDVTRRIIDDNSSYLEKPFTEMNLQELQKIKSDCRDYMSDDKVRDFVKKVDAVAGNLSKYDYMAEVTNSPYSKENVERALASLAYIDSNALTQVQKQEISALKEQLESYSEGLMAFREYISEINKRRDGVNYSMEYFTTDNELILKKNNLGKRIEGSLKEVPYLRNKFEEFIEGLKRNPDGHSKAEIEILDNKDF